MTEYYARRLFNPMRGVMQVVKCEHADATCLDGDRWGLYVTDEYVYDRDDFNSVAPSRMPLVKYGEWSAGRGVSLAPLPASMDHEHVHRVGEQLLARVKRLSHQLPFQLVDDYECWLLDDVSGEPVALLHTAVTPDEVSSDAVGNWRVGQLARREFLPTPAGLELPQLQIGAYAELLEEMVNSRCSRLATQWYLRGLASEQGIAPGVQAAPEQLPRYGLTLNWAEAQQRLLVEAYLRWLSPCLLLMYPQQKDTEQWLPFALEYPLRLYPVRKLLSSSLLADSGVRQVLVQAQLQRSSGSSD